MAYNSPRTKGNHEAFYNLLRSSETLETDKITSELHLHQDGKLLRVEKATADLHIRENPTSLTIYVPEDETSQDFCFNSKLPQLLCEWIMTEPTSQIQDHVPREAVNAVQSVLNVKKSRALAKVLDHHGVTLLDDPAEEAEELEREETYGSEREQVEELEEEDHGVAGPAGSRTALQPNIQLIQSRTPDNYRSDSSATEDLGTDTPPSSFYSPAASRSPRNEEISYLTAGSSYASSAQPRLQPVDVHSSVPDSGEYTTLLHKVVNAARRTGFPSQGAFDMSAIRAALGSSTLDEGDEDPYRPRSISKLERDKQVGAAGELFVSVLIHPPFHKSSRNINPSLAGFRAALSPRHSAVWLLPRRLAKHYPQLCNKPPGLLRHGALERTRDSRHYVRRLQQHTHKSAHRQGLSRLRCLGRRKAAVLYRSQDDDGALRDAVLHEQVPVQEGQ